MPDGVEIQLDEVQVSFVTLIRTFYYLYPHLKDLKLKICNSLPSFLPSFIFTVFVAV
jgi:hypothetical protein